MAQVLESIRKFVLYRSLLVWRTKAFWARAIICWLIGVILLTNDEAANFDIRLRIRGPRKSTAPIVIIDLTERDWNQLVANRNVLRPLKEVGTFNDAYFWQAHIWEKLLRATLNAQPVGVGVTFFFGDQIAGAGALMKGPNSIFTDPRIVWGADVDSAGQVLLPAFATTYNVNVGLRGFRTDDDGIVRRFWSNEAQVGHMSVKLAALSGLLQSGKYAYLQSTLINFVGGESSFQVFGILEVLEGRVPAEALRGKTVLIGSLANPLEQMQTPLGRMSRTEALANIIDNLELQRSITRLPNHLYVALLLGLMISALWVLATYPQSVALVFFILAGILWSAASAAAFDLGLFWLPVLSPLVQLTVTYIVFMSYRLSVNEQRTWRLQQEQHYLSEIERLKTNFVSMMSHDLKTPIAKIQAICDRLLAAPLSENVQNDLRSLRRSSDELHRYIQSILQVTKVEAKDFKINKEVTDINENIEKVVARLQPLAQEKQIQIVMQLEPMFSIEADTTLLQEIVHNLVENAIKFSPQNGRIRVVSEEKDDNVVVVVEDSGPGIAADEQEKIWGKFTRGQSLEHATKGTGLGLYLVKYFVELHGGRVFLQSDVGSGTKIGFSLPISLENLETA